MKRKIIMICIVCSMVLCLLLSAVACKNKHAHTFAEAWTSDSEYHWHAATCEHKDEVSAKSAHTFGEDGVCSVCKHKKSGSSGDNTGHTHTFSPEWTYDSTYHWHAATCGHSDQTADKAQHQPDRGGKCKVCGQTSQIEPTKQLLYELSEDETSYTVTGLGDDSEEVTDIIIPATYNGKPVTKIARNAFMGNTVIEYAFIPDSVTEIGWQTFRNCTSLTEVRMSSNLTLLEMYAFCSCSSLTDITIPKGVDVIDEYTFFGCKALNSITFTDGNTLTKIGNNAFRQSGIKYINIPKSVTLIEEYAFYKCALEKIDFAPDSQLAEIQKQAFAAMENLYTITIPSNVTTIGTDAFHLSLPLIIYCKVPEKPDGWHKQWNTNSLLPVVWDCDNNNVATDGYIHYIADNGLHFALKDDISEIAPTKYSLQGITDLPDTVTYENKNYTVRSLRDHAFFGLKGITDITIPDTVTRLDQYAFSDCSNLKSIKLSKNIKNLGYNAFRNCISLQEIDLPKDIEAVNAFSGCTSLTKVTLPKSAAINGFDNCTSLSKIVIPVGTTYVGWDAFKGCNNLSIECEAPSKPSYWHSDWNSGNRPVTWGSAGVNSNSEYQYVVNDNEVYLTKYLGSSTTINVPNTIDSKPVVSILGDCFNNCVITEITLPANLKKISPRTFRGKTSLTSIRIPDSVTRIGAYAFSGCTSLTKVITPANLTAVEEYSFENCSKLATLYFPASVTVVESFALEGTGKLWLYCGAQSRPDTWEDNYKTSWSHYQTFGHDGSGINE